MSDKLRVHTLSKELGVTSKAIIEKCKNEGVEGVTNHMSTVSAGLAETVREWFSAASGGTAVEEAPPVDLAKAKIRAPRKKKAAAKDKEGAEKAPDKKKAKKKTTKKTATAAEETSTPSVADEPEAMKSVAIAPEAPFAEVEPAAPTVVTEAPPPETAPETVQPAKPVEPEAPATVEPPEVVRPAARIVEPKPPKPREPVTPAGPQNIPAPAQMRGPKVIGFSKPDPITPPVPRSGFRSPPLPMIPPSGPMEEAVPGRRGGKGKGLRDVGGPTKRGRRLNPRRSGTLLSDVGERLKEWNDRDLLERQERLAAASGRGIHARRAREKKTGSSPAGIAPRKTSAQITEPVVVHELCAATGIGMMQLMPKLMNEHGMGLINRNTVIPTDVAQVAMLDFGVDLEVVKPRTALDKLIEEFAARERTRLQSRPPVVTMLGHVDHGKTSLLDAIRRTSVVDGEAGGITQHIGAYQVERGDLSVTFFDTPGHEAFTAMRARGAHMTDVVVLVVAADDGVMPQTIEAINHAKAAKVTILVALNKIDLPGVDINKVYGQLAEMELAPTEWGGETDVVKTSATTGQGIEELIEHLAVLSELLDLKADPTVPATGAVIEAEMQQGVGPVARVLVKEGTLRTGSFVVCGPGAGRVRAMRDDRGRQIREATPGMPVEIAGLDEVPVAGDIFYCVDSLQRAKEIAEKTAESRRNESLTKVQKARTLEDLFLQRESGEIPELNLILRADVQGSLDALSQALGEIPSEEVKLTFLHTGIGSVTESDVVLASASGALIIGFNVTTDAQAQQMAEVEGVSIRSYRVIYDVIDDVRAALEGLLPTDKSEENRGKAEVREVFHISKVGLIAGCLVTEGQVARSHYVRVIRDGQIIIPTEDDVKKARHRAIVSLRRFKEDTREVRAGMECGIRIERFDDIKPGDLIEAYEVIETARTL